MGSSCGSKIKAVKFYNDIEASDKKQDDDLRVHIRLEFFLKNCNSDFKYSINAFLLDQKGEKFSSEEKEPNEDMEIKFENFFVCEYYFEKEQNIQIILYRDNTPINIQTTLGYISGSRFGTYTKTLETNEMLFIRAQKLGKGNSQINVNIKLLCDNNEEKKFFKKNKYIFIVMSNNNKIYSSESISNEGTFDKIKIPCYLLSPEYKIEFYSINNLKKVIASYNMSTDKLQIKTTNIIRLKIPISKDILLSVQDDSEYLGNYTIFDFLSAGVKIKLSIGIDYTGSNGHPLDSGTLHSIIDDKPNDYERVIKSIGKILSNYSSDQKYPVYGFGAIENSNPYNEVSMCFNINFEENPEIHTLDNVINVYHESLKKLTFSGPTLFSPILYSVINQIKTNNDILEYNILMILTDGVLDDMDNTINALVEGSFEPLSVIIVGIGNADFAKMVILDGNDNPLISQYNIKWMRDLVQFVPFNKFENDEAKFNKEILDEISRQIIEFYNVNNYTPEKIRDIISIQHSNTIKIYKGLDKIKEDEDLPTKSQIFFTNNNNNNKEIKTTNGELNNDFYLFNNNNL